MRRALLTLLAIFMLATPGAAAQGIAPAGFVGISPQGPTSGRDYELMALAGVESVRLPLYWFAVEPQPEDLYEPDWSSFDHDVALAAAQGLRVFPFVIGTPEWVAPFPTAEPVESGWQRFAWKRFLGDAVRRYGPGGEFWDENPELPRLPIRRWEIWNEENIVTFSHHPSPTRFAQLIRISGRVLHRADPGSQVIAGGFFGRPLQVPPNIRSGDFLSRVYRAGRVKRFFDGVALHPYVAQAGAMRAEIRNLRRVMRVHHDAATPLFVTELGWGSDSFESRWERGWLGQARELDRAFEMLTANRRRWRIGGAWWFSWADQYDACQFCDSAGLLTVAREAKPSWYAFNAWTGGDADAVPRASAGDSGIGP
jgi:polysaccharide biosynthesis protein PslG